MQAPLKYFTELQFVNAVPSPLHMFALGISQWAQIRIVHFRCTPLGNLV